MASKKKYSNKLNTPRNKNVKKVIKNVSKPKIDILKYLPLSLLFLDIILVFIIRSKFLNIPFERDEGAYSYYGKLLLEGKRPYIDFFEQKFPGIFYNYALIVLLFGATLKGMHLGFLFVNIFTIILIYFIGKQLYNEICGIVSAMSFSLVSLIPGLSGFTVQSEHLVAFYACIGTFFLLKAIHKNNLWLFFLCGIFYGLSFMTKTNGIFFCIFGGLAILVYVFLNKPINWKNVISYPVAFSIGVLIICAVFFLLIILKGAFKDMIFWTYIIPKSYINIMPLSEGIKYFKMTFTGIKTNYMFFWMSGLFGIISIFIIKTKLYKKIILILLAIFSIMTIVPGYFFYGHYFILLLPALSIFIGIFFYAIYYYLSNLKYKKGAKIIPIIIFLIFFIKNLSSQEEYYFNPNYTKILKNVYGINPFPESKVIADFITSKAQPNDKIIIIGSEPEIYFYTGIDCPSKYAYFSALVSNVPEHKKWQREFIRDVESSKPKFFIFFNNAISLLVQANTDKLVFTWANEYINKNYKIIGIIDQVDQYNSNYVWGDDVFKYKPQSQYTAYVFERKI